MSAALSSTNAKRRTFRLVFSVFVPVLCVSGCNGASGARSNVSASGGNASSGGQFSNAASGGVHALGGASSAGEQERNGSLKGGEAGLFGGASGGSGGVPATGGADSSAGTSEQGGAVHAAGGSPAGGASAGAGGGSGESVFPSSVVKPRIAIVGDSISAGPGCYKKYLLQQLTTNHYSKFEFVGEYGDDCGSTVRHSAVSCSTTSQWIGATFTMPNCSQGKVFAGMSTVVKDETPDLVMIQLGVNDVWGSTPTETILKNYTTLVSTARAANSRVVLIVAQIHQIKPSCTDTATYDRARALVLAAPSWAEAASTPDSPVFVADLWTNSDYSQSVGDCVHPDDAGAQRMGLNWFNALKTVLKQD